MDKKTVGENVRRERMKKLLTQTELAEKTGLSKVSIINIEKGRKMSVDSLGLIAAALNISASTLMRGAV